MRTPADALFDALNRLEPRGRPVSCDVCGHVFVEEVIWRRVYETNVGLALAGLCGRCAVAVPRGSAAEAALRAQLERRALADAPPQGRA